MSVLRVNELLIKKNVTRQELSDKIGVSLTAISYICSGKNNPTVALLLKIAEALDVDIRELFNPTKGGMVSHEELKDAKELLHRGMKLLNVIN